ncbi:hypothetical protein [Tsukamurella pulmonis]|uniref:hypothetical protein n=1 Tax=Tsukamurella pulmonis TaxID=47312 RepID=UPI001A9DB9EA|nr:hypothetical protein [Tsukamurella pulmonis]
MVVAGVGSAVVVATVVVDDALLSGAEVVSDEDAGEVVEEVEDCVDGAGAPEVSDDPQAGTRKTAVSPAAMSSVFFTARTVSAVGGAGWSCDDECARGNCCSHPPIPPAAERARTVCV